MSFSTQAKSFKSFREAQLNQVGQTSKGRKGTSWSQTKRLLDQVDENWAANRIQHGLSTGEGLIWAVRDAGIEHNAVDDKRALLEYFESFNPVG